ncbi:zinc-binding dehydrogenase [Nocardia sp. NBC_01730]|uniref:zinc-binding dehydrogenase n=1 Tax=Nocardia sp. NBC_01730 TaxID=2975998 RepID=UPI003FA3B943
MIDYTTGDFTETVDKVDVVLDLVGGTYGSRSLPVLRADGRYIDFQSSDAATDPRYHRVAGHPSPATLAAMATLADQGKLHIEVGHLLPLSAVTEAHRLSESGRVRGKIVLTPWE